MRETRASLCISHVRGNGARAKFWIKPVALAENVGFPAHELNGLIGVINENQDLIERVWHEYFST
jgi:hypothetical protein